MKRFLEPNADAPSKKAKTEPNKIPLSLRSWVLTQEQVLDNPDPDFEALKSEMWDDVRPVYHIMGKPVISRRTQRFYSSNPKILYRFTGGPKETRTDIPPLVLRCAQVAKQLYPEHDFNGFLVNLYKDSSDHIGPHSDSESELVPGAPILSFSFGAKRRFVIHAIDKTHFLQRYQIPMPHNFLIVMGGDMQKEFKHQVPVVGARELTDSGPRINVTIRSFKV